MFMMVVVVAVIVSGNFAHGHVERHRLGYFYRLQRPKNQAGTV
jgi:hypothetical protein